MELFIFARFHVYQGNEAVAAAVLREQIEGVRSEPDRTAAASGQSNVARGRTTRRCDRFAFTEQSREFCEPR